jgi:Zn-dependent protease with chaperone function
VRVTALLLALLLASPACAAQRSRSLAQGYPKPGGFNIYSRDQEVAVGKEASAEVDKQMPVLEASHPVSQYVRRLGEKLAAQSPAPKYPYTFKVVNMKEINAFALPGGPVYVNLGVIRAADNEAEVAGVVGHEIGHIMMRHATRQASKGALAQLGAAVLGGALGGGVGGQLAQLGIQVGATGVFLKYSRDAERESDLVGARLMYDAGYNPQAAVSFFRKLEQQSGGARGPEFLSSHPNPGNRAANVAEAIKGLPAKSYTTNTADFNRIKETAMAMKPLTAEEVAKRQKQGGAGSGAGSAGTAEPPRREDVMPSGSFATYDHSAFRVRRPQNWEVVEGRSGVTIGPRAGLMENAVAYGVIVGAHAPESRSLDGATEELVRNIQQQNPQVQVRGRMEAIRVNSVDARSVELTGPSPIRGGNGQPLRERNWMVTLPRQDGSVLYLVFVAPEKDYGALQGTFEDMLRSLRVK